MTWIVEQYYQRPRGADKIGIDRTIIGSNRFSSRKRALDYMKEVLKTKGASKIGDYNNNPIIKVVLGNNEYYSYRLRKA